MREAPYECPQCGNRKKWKEEVNIFTSGVPTAAFGRIRLFGLGGIFGSPLRKLFGLNKVSYRCGKCGFHKKYMLDD